MFPNRLFPNRLFPNRLVVGLIGLGAIATLGACQQPSDTAVEPADDGMATEDTMTTEDSAGMESAGTIVEVAAGNESFSTLVQAVEAAGLVETLSAEGPYTVFAPTDEAFAALPEGTLEQLLQPENQETLIQILTYHVLPQEVPAAEVMSGDVATVAGPALSISVDEATGAVMVNEATVAQADVEASNGVIHVIDQVLLPPDLQL
jgi:uncharacterized surface protein with fasciclin (FAS1) repeats